MTCPIEVDRRDRNQRIDDTVVGTKSGKYKTYLEAACILQVPLFTVNARANGRPTLIEAHEYEQLLSAEEEKELAWWIHRLTIAGYPPKSYTI